MEKTVTIQVSLSTNPQVSGRYFVDVRDTTNGCNHQMTTRILDNPDSFIENVQKHAITHNVTVTVEDIRVTHPQLS